MCFIPLFRCSACSAFTSHQLCALLCPLRFRAALPSAESALQVLLAALAAAFAVLLFAPAQRFVRSFFLQMRPPEWAADYVAPHPVATAGLALHFLLPALTALLWVSEGRSCNLGCAAATGLGCAYHQAQQELRRRRMQGSKLCSLSGLAAPAVPGTCHARVRAGQVLAVPLNFGPLCCKSVLASHVM